MSNVRICYWCLNDLERKEENGDENIVKRQLEHANENIKFLQRRIEELEEEKEWKEREEFGMRDGRIWIPTDVLELCR